MINLLTLSKTNDCAKEHSVKSLPDHLSERSPDTLDLLVPWDIPLECSLSDPIKQKIEESLRSLLQALNNPDPTQARLHINQTLNTFPKPNTQTAQVKSTKTPLSTAAVEDYDTYFAVNHVQTEHADDTALSLTRSLLTNCNTFITLCCNIPKLDPQQISQQKQGFISYILLLTRVFNLNNFSK